MNIKEEKKYIYEMMRDITQERRKLTDIYYSLKERLDALNNLEIRGLDELSIRGYTDLYNEMDKKVSVDNIKRESEEAIKRVLESDMESENKKNISIIPKEEIDRAKRIDDFRKIKMSKSRGKKKTTQLSLKEIIPIIEEVLREKGIPMGIEEIRVEVEKNLDKEIDKGNFQRNILPRAAKTSNKIKRATRGYYQYVST